MFFPPPAGKQITATKTLVGFGPFLSNLTVAGTFKNAALNQANGQWNTTPPPAFNVGDLVLVQDPYSSVGAPAYLFFCCVEAYTPQPIPLPFSAYNPGYWNPVTGQDTGKWMPWGMLQTDIPVFVGMMRQCIAYSASTAGVSSYPAACFPWANLINNTPPQSSFLNISITTEIAGFGAQASYQTQASANGSYTSSWSCDRITGIFTRTATAATPVGTPPVSPTGDGWSYPNVPAIIYPNDNPPGAQPANHCAPILGSPSFSEDGSTLEIVFVLLYDDHGNAVETVTWRITLSTEYTIAEVISDAKGLAATVTFDSMAWNTKVSLSYNVDGSIQRVNGFVPAFNPLISGAIQVESSAPGETVVLGQFMCCGDYCLKNFFTGATVDCGLGLNCVCGQGGCGVAIDIPVPEQGYTQAYPNCACKPGPGRTGPVGTTPATDYYVG